MATLLTKAVKRELLSSTDRKGRKMIMTMEPGDLLSFRVKGSRRTVSIYIGHCISLAQIMTAETEYQSKMKEYQVKKKAGAQFLRKPKKPALFFGKIYYDALK